MNARPFHINSILGTSVLESPCGDVLKRESSVDTTFYGMVVALGAIELFGLVAGGLAR